MAGPLEWLRRVLSRRRQGFGEVAFDGAGQQAVREFRLFSTTISFSGCIEGGEGLLRGGAERDHL